MEVTATKEDVNYCWQENQQQVRNSLLNVRLTPAAQADSRSIDQIIRFCWAASIKRAVYQPYYSQFSATRLQNYPNIFIPH